MKAIARESMALQRGSAILTVFLVMLIIGAGGMFNIIPILGPIIVFATIFFVDYPLQVHMSGIFIKIFNREMVSAGALFDKFSINYARKIGGMAWMSLFTFLWSLLCFVPGIVKMYAYSMTPYILDDCPNVTATDALKLSMRMTRGYKMELFVLGLSFIGWHLLGILTCGILNIVYVGPYQHTTTAGYYLELRDKAIANGVIHPSEFTGGYGGYPNQYPNQHPGQYPNQPPNQYPNQPPYQ